VLVITNDLSLVRCLRVLDRLSREGVSLGAYTFNYIEKTAALHTVYPMLYDVYNQGTLWVYQTM